MGLKINVNKTKILTEGGRRYGIEEIDEFCYVESMVDKTGDSHTDIRRRIEQAQKSVNILFKTNVRSVLLNSVERWAINKQSTTNLKTFINKCPRKSYRIF